MADYKGENLQISLVEETTWGKPVASYANARVFQTNDGSFNAERSSQESEARTPNAELGGARLGQTNVAGSFPVEIDPYNYKSLFESAFYGEFTKTGSPASLTGAAFSSSKVHQITIEVSPSDQTALGVTVGSAYRLHTITDSTLVQLSACVVLIGITSTTLTFFCPEQTLASVPSTTSDVVIDTVDTLRPSTTRKSFNAESILVAEDGVSRSRFMTSGAIVTGVEFDIPSEGNLKSTFSLIGSGFTESSDYKSFDPLLTNSSNAHSSLVPHTKHDPMVLQDGAIISDETDTRCMWLSGTVTIENGTQTYFVGCSYDAGGAFSGKFRVNVQYEALFRSEADYTAFKAEATSKLLLKFKVRNKEDMLMLYLPAFKATSYSINVSTGLVTATISGSAEVDPDSINSAILATYTV